MSEVLTSNSFPKSLATGCGIYRLQDDVPVLVSFDSPYSSEWIDSITVFRSPTRQEAAECVGYTRRVNFKQPRKWEKRG